MKDKLIEIAFHVYGFCLMIVLISFLFGPLASILGYIAKV